MKPGIPILIFLTVVVAAGTTASSPQTPAAKKPAFDVISVKPDRAGGPPRRTGAEGNRFIAENVPLILLIVYAYRGGGDDLALFSNQVIGGPSWLSTDRFDIEAKLEGDIRAIPTRQTWLMVQSLLENRFKLRTHWETRPMPVYSLTIAKGGVKMKRSADQSPPSYDDDAEDSSPSSSALRGEIERSTSPSGETVISGAAISISPNLASRRPHALLPHSLVEILWGNADGRPVIDKTGLKGFYDFRLHFDPNPLTPNADATANNTGGPSLFSAFERQLGLKLESAKGAVPVLVIDSVEHPSEN